MTWKKVVFWSRVAQYLAFAYFSSAAYSQAPYIDYKGAIFQPSKDLAHWFESLQRPDFDASVDSVISCCDAGDAYPIVILQEASIGGKEYDGIAEVTDPTERLIIKPDGSKKWRQQWKGPLRFKYAGRLVTRELDGNPTTTAWVFAGMYMNAPYVYCVVPLPPGV